MPLSAAMRRASGLALTRSSSEDAGCAAFGSAALASVFSSAFGASLGSLAAGFDSSAFGAASFGGVSTADASSPSSARIAITAPTFTPSAPSGTNRSEEHTSELQSLMRISYAVFCLKKKIIRHTQHTPYNYRYNI